MLSHFPLLVFTLATQTSSFTVISDNLDTTSGNFGTVIILDKIKIIGFFGFNFHIRVQLTLS